MRDGNIINPILVGKHLFVFSLPMRDGNVCSNPGTSKINNRFLVFL